MTNRDRSKTLVQGFELPASSFLGDKTKEVLLRRCDEVQAMEDALSDKVLALDLRNAPLDQMPEIRAFLQKYAVSSPQYKSMKQRYRTTMQTECIAGVPVERFSPEDGVAEKNRDKILINLHGGSFMTGGRSQSHLESMPIASVGKINVVSVDYRMAPEHQFPAASDDVLAVYQHLLSEFPPDNIGIYGSSAGALLTAQSIAQMLEKGLPLPGAVGMLAAGAFYWMEGDSGPIGCAVTGLPQEEFQYKNDLYFREVSLDDASAFPGRAPAVLSQFPPSLLLSSTRDYALSSVVNTHSALIKLGVEADLHIWEGLDHVFYLDGDLSESREVYDVLVNFFDRHLGK